MVKLTATDASGSDARTRTDYITVFRAGERHGLQRQPR